ncbi:MAG TPA: asparaginase [Patescibacteria group bacterium]|nr:asparaginase [Patescibacteria group bacterium]
MLKKVLVIGYGGTIMMVVDEKRKSVVPAKNISEILKLVPKLSDVADVKLEILTNKDSTNVTPDDWTKLAFFIADQQDSYDAFVITHGTNTLAYTASALSLAFGDGLKKPIIVTGSQLPLSVYGNDARFNFENAIKTAVVASDLNIAEVMVVFADEVLRGSRTVKVSESAFDAFKSPAFPPLATITSTGVHFNQSLVKSFNPKAKLNLRPHFNTKIVSLDLTPGQLPSMIEHLITSGACKGVILKSFGAGSVPTEGEYSYLPFIKKVVNEYKIPVIVATKFLGGNTIKEINDECAVLAVEAGAIPAGDLTDVMTEVKLMWLLAQSIYSNEKVKQGLLRSYAGELSASL